MRLKGPGSVVTGYALRIPPVHQSKGLYNPCRKALPEERASIFCLLSICGFSWFLLLHVCPLVGLFWIPSPDWTFHAASSAGVMNREKTCVAHFIAYQHWNWPAGLSRAYQMVNDLHGGYEEPLFYILHTIYSELRPICGSNSYTSTLCCRKMLHWLLLLSAVGDCIDNLWGWAILLIRLNPLTLVAFFWRFGKTLWVQEQEGRSWSPPEGSFRKDKGGGKQTVGEISRDLLPTKHLSSLYTSFPMVQDGLA